jgi:hypothetical protein
MIIPIIQTVIRTEVKATTYYKGDVMAEYANKYHINVEFGNPLVLQQVIIEGNLSN